MRGRVAIIPARGGSQRIPRKNIRKFHGKPIIAYSIEAAQRSGMFDQVVVSTDDLEIMQTASHYGALPVYRETDMAKDEVGTQDVVRAVLKQMDFYKVACCIYATAPMLHYSTLRDACALLDRDEAACYVVPVSTWLRDPGQFYLGRADAFIRQYPLVGSHTRILRIDPSTDQDINVESDWLIAERMYAELNN